MTTPEDVLAAAKAWYEIGAAVIPPVHSGKKAPLVDWKVFQSERPAPERMASWYTESSKMGVGILCGKISGNLEMLEAESCVWGDPEFIFRIGLAIAEAGLDPLWASLLDGYHEFTPSGGLHLIYRITDHDVPGNTKIASRPKDPADYTDRDRETLAKAPGAVIMQTLIETRGEGGYVVVAPSQGPVHPSGNPWTLGAGCEPGRVPEITWEQREALVAVLSKFDVPRPQRPRPERPVVPVVPQGTGGKRVGDDFNERGDWAEILEPHGWTFHHIEGHTTYWERPGGSTTGEHSATTGHDPSADRLYVFSSSTVFPTEEPISKFAAFTELNFGGDWKSATKALAAQGYGEQRTAPPKPPSFGNLVAPVVTRDFHEPDQPVSEVPAAYDAGAKGTTAPRDFLPRPRGVVDYTFSGTATRFVDHCGAYVRYVPEQGIWRFWDGTRWVLDAKGARVSQAFEALTEQMRDEAATMEHVEGRQDMAAALKKHVTKLRDSSRSSILGLIATKVSVSVDAFDGQTRYLNLRNGVWDCRDMTFLAHDPKYMLTKMMNCSYDPDADAPKTRKFLMETIVNDEMRRYAVRAMGYTMTGEADQKAFFLLHGGSNVGKTQTQELLTDFFGDYAVTADAGTFHKRHDNTGPNPGLHALRGARLVTTSETSQDSRLDEELLKRFTGKDRMSTRTVYQDQQEWIPQCTVWVATNHLPKFSSDEDAIWRRVKTIPFTTTFSDDGSSGHRAVANLGRKLAKEEADGIFNLFLDGLREYREFGGLAEPAELKESVAEHKREVDPVAQFWDEKTGDGELVEQGGGEVSMAVVFDQYLSWCKDNRVMPLGSRRFANSLRPWARYDKLVKRGGKTIIPGWHATGINGVRGTMRQ